MVILGLTGSIGMGKTTAAALLRRLGVPVHDADAAVHRLLEAGGGAVASVAAAFPGTVRRGAVDRAALGALVFADPVALARLEALLHPLVTAGALRFLKRCAARRCPVAVLDIPLLYETGAERRCDRVMVVSAPLLIQRQRVLRRPGMTPAKFAAILARQLPDAEKRRRADLVIPSGAGRGRTLRALARAVRLAKAAPGRRWPPHPLHWQRTGWRRHA